MTLGAPRQHGFAGIRSIFPKVVTVLAEHAYLFLVDGVVVIKGLVLGGIKKLRKNYPTNEQGTSEAKDKEDPTYKTRTLLLCFSSHGTPRCFGVLV
jgi:hypothetical protein